MKLDIVSCMSTLQLWLLLLVDEAWSKARHDGYAVVLHQVS